MEEPNSSQVPHSELLDEISPCGGGSDCHCEGGRHPNSLSMPICFLVREQAKSLVAIQDLQNRLSQVENVQADLIDNVVQFRNHFIDTNELLASPSFLNSTNSPVFYSTSKFGASAYHSTIEPPRSILKSSYSAKANDFQKVSSIVTIQEQPQKHFVDSKCKDSSALESDKQDSGLDSDCREHHDGHASLRTASNCISHGNDPLLQLLDEISFRSEYLQKQLSVVEETTVLSEANDGMQPARSEQQASACTQKVNCHENIPSFIEETKSKRGVGKSNFADVSHEVGIQVALPPDNKFNTTGFAGFLEKKSFKERSPTSKRIGRNIDSTKVCSILKETSVVDLQRQSLIYLVDNAVLHTKLRESEQALACKNIESEKVENSLKEEARLLMMENRELRICLDEQKMESNVLKSRVAMLERILESMNLENQELNFQLGESLNLQYSKKGRHNLSSSVTTANPSCTSRFSRKSSSLPSQTGRNSTLNYAKSKLISSANSYLDATAEEQDECESDQIQISRLNSRNGPLQSSTPFQRTRGNVIDSFNSPGLPTSFYSLKKCLKSGHSFDSENGFKTATSERYGSCDIPEACVKRSPSLSQSSSQKGFTLPSGNISQFPFNTILEKLKTNSEIRLSRSVPNVKDGEASVSASDHEVEHISSDITAAQLKRYSKSPQGSGKGGGDQPKRSSDIHQRIQNILDRIVAESEEAS